MLHGMGKESVKQSEENLAQACPTSESAGKSDNTRGKRDGSHFLLRGFARRKNLTGGVMNKTCWEGNEY